MAQKYSFERLCVHNVEGYAFDQDSVYKPNNPETFDEVISKITTKIETSIIFLQGQKGSLIEFTIISFPVPDSKQPLGLKGKAKKWLMQSKDIEGEVEDVWNDMSNIGWNGLQVVAILSDASIPDNGSRIYPLEDYSSSLMQCIKAYFQFQKPNTSYIWSERSQGANHKNVAFAFLWKIESPRGLNSTFSMTVVKRNITTKSMKHDVPSKRLNLARPHIDEESPPKRQKQQRLPEAIRKVQPMEVEEESSDDDNEITFKDFVIQPVQKESPPKVEKRGRGRKPKQEPPQPIVSSKPKKIYPELPKEIPSKVQVVKRGRGRPKFVPDNIDRNQNHVEAEPEPEGPLADVTLGFEMSTSAAPRKSGVRKSMVNDWPEDEKLEILRLFDNLNPDMPEQKKVSLTCRYVAIQFEKDLTSKQLYIWIQKKGRQVERLRTNFNISESESKKEMIEFYKSLNNTQPESTRISFTLKYFQSQYGINVPSKTVYVWLSEKPVVKKGRKAAR